MSVCLNLDCKLQEVRDPLQILYMSPEFRQGRVENGPWETFLKSHE